MSTKRNTAITSVLSHLDEQEKGSYPKQAQQVLHVLAGRELNARQIRAEIARRWDYLELSSCHRAINTLMRSEAIEVAKLDKCPTTKKTVRFYRITQKKRGSN